MRVTIALLGFGLGAVMFAQTFLVYGLSNITSDSESSSAAQAGLTMVVLWLLASAFVFGVPWLSLAFFVIAGVVGIANATHFPDLQIWGTLSLVLAGLTVIHLWQVSKSRRPSPNASGVVASGAMKCPNCGASNPGSSRYCSGCGSALASTACATCGTQFRPGDAFCGNCGAGLPAILPTSASSNQPKLRGHIPLAVGFLLFALGQLFALGRDAGVAGYGNLFGLVFLVAFLGWMIYWVKKNGTGGIRLPASVWSLIRPSTTNQSTGSSVASHQFPFAMAVGILFIAGLVSSAIAVVDTQYSSVRVNGGGMEPALPEGSMWTVAGDAYASNSPQRGDLVLYADANEWGQSVKRVIGLPGEHVVISNGKVQVDGTVLDEPYADDSTRCSRGDTCDIVLGPGEIYLLGDNRSNSKDSRNEGPGQLSAVRGKIVKPFLQLGFR